MTSIYQKFTEARDKDPNKVAIYFEGEAISFLDLDRRVESLCDDFERYGIAEKAIIGLVIPNSITFVCMMLAAAKTRCIIVPFAASLPVSQLLSNSREMGLDVVIVIESHSLFNTRDKVALKQINQCCALFQVNFNSEKLIPIRNEALPSHLNILGHNSEDDTTEFNLRTNMQELSLDTDENPFIVTMTSGSTSAPKPILLTQETKLKRIQAAVELYQIDEQDVILAATPLYHSLADRLLLIGLTRGLSVVLLAGYSKEVWLEAVRRYAVTFTIAVSSQLKQISEVLDKNTSSIRSMRCLVSSSERLDANTKKKLIEELSCEFHECYGTSEMSIVSNLSPADLLLNPKTNSSVGKAAPGVEIKIVDSENKELETNRVGEIVCRSHLIFSGYLAKNETIENSFYQGFFKTGDYGSIDELGFLYFHGRLKDIIISGGVNIYPKDVESVLAQHPNVEEVCVTAIPDDKLGEVVGAVIVKRNGMAVKNSELRKLCLSNLADYQFPRRYFFVDEICKTAMGKIKRSDVAKQVLA